MDTKSPVIHSLPTRPTRLRVISSTGEPWVAHTEGRKENEMLHIRYNGTGAERQTWLGYKVSWMLVWAAFNFQKRAGVVMGWQDGSGGKGTSAKPHLITSSVKKRTHSWELSWLWHSWLQAHMHIPKCNNKILSYVIQQHNRRWLVKNSSNLSIYRMMNR